MIDPLEQGHLVSASRHDVNDWVGGDHAPGALVMLHRGDDHFHDVQVEAVGAVQVARPHWCTGHLDRVDRLSALGPNAEDQVDGVTPPSLRLPVPVFCQSAWVVFLRFGFRTGVPAPLGGRHSGIAPECQELIRGTAGDAGAGPLTCIRHQTLQVIDLHGGDYSGCHHSNGNRASTAGFLAFRAGRTVSCSAFVVDTPASGAAPLMLTLWRWMWRSFARASSGLSSLLTSCSRWRLTRRRIKARKHSIAWPQMRCGNRWCTGATPISDLRTLKPRSMSTSALLRLTTARGQVCHVGHQQQLPSIIPACASVVSSTK